MGFFWENTINRLCGVVETSGVRVGGHWNPPCPCQEPAVVQRKIQRDDCCFFFSNFKYFAMFSENTHCITHTKKICTNRKDKGLHVGTSSCYCFWSLLYLPVTHAVSSLNPICWPLCQIMIPDKRTTRKKFKDSCCCKCQTATAGDTSLLTIKRVDVEKEEKAPGRSENNGVEGKW